MLILSALRIRTLIFLFMCISFSLKAFAEDEGKDDRTLVASAKEIFATMKPGTAYRRDVFVKNTSSEIIPIQAYVWDLWHKGEDEVYAPQGTYQASSAQWITVSPQKLSLAPGRRAKFHINIFIPAGATGGNYAVIFFDTIPPLELASGHLSRPDRKSGHKKRIKIGIPTYIEVEGTGRTDLDIKRFSIGTSGGSESIKTEFLVKNTGNIHVKPIADIKIYNNNKSLVWHYPPKILTINKIILPEQELSIKVEWKKILKPGRYTAVLKVSYGSNQTKTIQRDFKI